MSATWSEPCALCGHPWDNHAVGLPSPCEVADCIVCPDYHEPSLTTSITAAIDRLTTAVYYLAAEHRAARLDVGMNDAVDQVLRSRKALDVVVAYEAKHPTT